MARAKKSPPQVKKTPKEFRLPQWKIISIKLILLCALISVWYVAFASLKIFYSALFTHEAQQLINTKRAPEAEASAIRSVLFDQDNGYAHYYLGAYYYLQGRMEEAERELLQALRTIAHPATPLLLLAEINLVRHRDKEAVHYFNETFKMEPKPSIEVGKRWHSFGDAAANAGESALGIYAFQQAINFNFTRKEVFKGLGRQFLNLGLPLMAVLAFERQILNYPEEKKFYSDLVAALGTIGDADEGIRFFSQLRQKVNRPEVIIFLASFYMQKKDFDAAIELMRALLLENPQEATALFTLGICHYEKSEFAEAEKYFRLFLQTKPTSAPAKKRAEQMLEKIKSMRKKSPPDKNMQ